jgi:hypothetical protein
MLDKKNTMSILAKTQKNSSIADIKFALYSVFTTLLLSFELFPTNVDLAQFINDNDIFDKKGESFRPYVLRNRTLLLSRILRVIYDSQDKDVLLHLLVVSKKTVFGDSLYKSGNSRVQRDTSNRFDDLFKQFSDGDN